MKILGLDIGGANTKAALIEFEKDNIKNSTSYIEFFPFWEKTITEIPAMLKRVKLNLQKKHFLFKNNIDFFAIAITAELSDAFQTKREGIYSILNALEQVFQKEKMYFISTKYKFLQFSEAKNEFLSISAANWFSTALFLGKFISECILIDAGSTTVDIIPIFNSSPVVKGKTDVERLYNHELIYTGGLRATIPSITHFVPYKGKKIRIAFEKFALISDVHRILNNITKKQYINDTADNRSKSLEDCYARLSRIICMDIESISKEELDLIAQYIYEKQQEIISNEIQLLMHDLVIRFPQFEKNPRFIITGLSADFLIRVTLENIGYNNISSYKEITQIPDETSSSAFAVAGALYYQL